MDPRAIIDVFMERHACKLFNADKKISTKDFNCILAAGQLSPSSFGFEPWKFLVVQDSTLRKKLLPVTWGGLKQIPTCSHFVVYLAKKPPLMKYGSDYLWDIMKNVHYLPDTISQPRMAKYEAFQRDDFKLLESDRAMFDWACKQVYIALANMMTTATLLGADSCPIEGYDQAAVDKILVEDFGVNGDEYGVACMCCFGYRGRNPREKTRQEIDKVVEWFK